MDEAGLEASLLTYKAQLEQVDAALAGLGGVTNDDLEKLKADLKQVIELTEASLLSMKKSRLLAFVDDGSTNSSSGNVTEDNNDMDAEFAAFQAAISGQETNESNTSGLAEIPQMSTAPEASASHTQDDIDGQGLDFTDISGSKCRAPFSHDWGESGFFNAMIVGVESIDEDSEPQVRVVFTHPIHQAMQPCPFYLEDRCRFDDDKCRYSHGRVVDVCDLKEFIEPDFSLLKIDTKCLAKNFKGLWKPGTVVDVLENHQFGVMYDPSNIVTVDLEEIIPMTDSNPEDTINSDSDFEDDEDVDLAIKRSDDEDSEDELPVYLWKPNQTTEKLGEWETHTKGIGSMLMRKMGYIMGQGLGKNCEGRSEPVPIQLLPQGKSLDRIMKLKEIAGDQDVFDVLKKKKKNKRKKGENKQSEPKTEKSPSVFDFLNKKIHINKHKGNIKTLAKHKSSEGKSSQDVTHISMKELKQKSDKNINIQLFQTHQEMSKAQKEITRLKSTWARHKNSEPVVASKIQSKITSMEKYLTQLRNSEKSIQNQKKARSDHKKITIF